MPPPSAAGTTACASIQTVPQSHAVRQDAALLPGEPAQQRAGRAQIGCARVVDGEGVEGTHGVPQAMSRMPCSENR